MKKRRKPYSYEEWEKLPEEDKNKPFSHPRWHDIPMPNKTEEPEEISDELRKQREEDDKKFKELLKKWNLPKRSKQD